MDREGIDSVREPIVVHSGGSEDRMTATSDQEGSREIGRNRSA